MFHDSAATSDGERIASEFPFSPQDSPDSPGKPFNPNFSRFQQTKKNSRSAESAAKISDYIYSSRIHRFLPITFPDLPSRHIILTFHKGAHEAFGRIDDLQQDVTHLTCNIIATKRQAWGLNPSKILTLCSIFARFPGHAFLNLIPLCQL